MPNLAGCGTDSAHPPRLRNPVGRVACWWYITLRRSTHAAPRLHHRPRLVGACPRAPGRHPRRPRALREEGRLDGAESALSLPRSDGAPRPLSRLAREELRHFERRRRRAGRARSPSRSPGPEPLRCPAHGRRPPRGARALARHAALHGADRGPELRAAAAPGWRGRRSGARRVVWRAAGQRGAAPSHLRGPGLAGGPRRRRARPAGRARPARGGGHRAGARLAPPATPEPGFTRARFPGYRRPRENRGPMHTAPKAVPSDTAPPPARRQPT